MPSNVSLTNNSVKNNVCYPIMSGWDFGAISTCMTAVDAKMVAKIGATIKKVRIAKGLTQEAVADASGFATHSWYNRLENGHRDTIEITQLARIAEVLGVPITDLISGQDSDQAFADQETFALIVQDVIEMLTELKRDGRLDLSEDLFRPWAEAVAERAMKEAAERDLPLSRLAFSKVSDLISKR